MKENIFSKTKRNKSKFRNVAYLDNTLGGVLGTRNENNLQLSMLEKQSINSKIYGTDHILQANKNEYSIAFTKTKTKNNLPNDGAMVISSSHHVLSIDKIPTTRNKFQNQFIRVSL